MLGVKFSAFQTIFLIFIQGTFTLEIFRLKLILLIPILIPFLLLRLLKLDFWSVVSRMEVHVYEVCL
jgi:hypothetical protein